MMAVFVLLAFLALGRYRRKPGPAWMGAVAGCFSLALLCKEAAILFPVLAFLLLALPSARGRGRDWLSIALLVVLAAAYLAVRSVVLRGPQPAWGDVSPTQRVLAVLNALGRYTFVTAVPFRHRLSYPDLARFARFGWPTVVAIAAMAVWSRSAAMAKVMPESRQAFITSAV